MVKGIVKLFTRWVHSWNHYHCNECGKECRDGKEGKWCGKGLCMLELCRKCFGEIFWVDDS